MSAAQVSNLSTILRNTARLFPRLPALIHGQDTWSWSEIDKRVDAMANAMTELGVKKGDKILVQSRNCLQLFESCWVAFRLGCVWVPVNYRLTPPEVANLGESSHSSVMIAEDIFEQHVASVQAQSADLRHVIWIGSKELSGFNYEKLVEQNLGSHFQDCEVDYDLPAWFFFTSGTTGRPKAGVLTHGQMTFVITNHLADLIPGTTENDASIAVAPLSHGAGIHALLNVARGAKTVLLPGEKLDPELVWSLISRYKVSNLFTVPTIVKVLVEHPSVDHHDHSSLRYVIYAGAPMYRSDQKLALQKLGKVLVQYFGLGEVTGCITVQPPHFHSTDDNDPNAYIGSCGRARTGMEVAILGENLEVLKIGEVGEICCRGPAVFLGYYDNPDATTKALRGGWFHTGDLGRMDDRGMVYITGRESDMYISGGSNVYPREVEEVLLAHPEIQEVAVLGIPHEKWGEVGVAVIVCRSKRDAIDADVVFKHLEGKCARYRWPHHVFFWDSLPKSAYGKITKKDIRTELIARNEIQEPVLT